MKLRVSALVILFCFQTSSVTALASSRLCDKSEGFLKKFLALDYNGGRLASNPQVNEMIEGPEQPGWDAAAVVTGYQILSCDLEDGEAMVTVSYDIMGSLSASSLLDRPDFSSGLQHEKHQFHIFDHKGKLRLRDAANFKPHVSLEAAVQDLHELAKQNPMDPAVTKGAAQAIAHMKDTEISIKHHPKAQAPSLDQGDREPASTFEP